MEDFGAKATAIVRESVNRVAAEACEFAKDRTVELTPKGATGNAKAGWRFEKDPKSIDFYAGESAILRNDEPYMKKLEWGSSKQAPTGMLNVTLREVPAEIERLGTKEGAKNG